MRNSEGGVACRWAGEVGRQGGCPILTSSEDNRQKLTEEMKHISLTAPLTSGYNNQVSFQDSNRRVLTLDGEDSAGADSGRLRGGTGGGTGISSEPRLKLTMDETEDDPETSKYRDTVRTTHRNE